jgi:hypothetical protein
MYSKTLSNSSLVEIKLKAAEMPFFLFHKIKLQKRVQKKN